MNARLLIAFTLLTGVAHAQGKFDAPLGEDGPLPVLGTGSKGASVAGARRLLNEDRRRRGLEPVEGGSTFDPALALALIDYQQAHGLPITGGVDAATWKSLGAPQQQPEPRTTRPELRLTEENRAPEKPFRPRYKAPATVSLHLLASKDGKRPLAFTSGMTICADGVNGKKLDRRNGQNRTALFDPAKKGGKPRYLDATKDRYVVLPSWVAEKYGVEPGDLAAVVRGDRVVSAVFGDTGPADQLGEGSIALARALGLDADTWEGGTAEHELTYVFFPGSGNRRIPASEELDRRLPELLASLGESKGIAARLSE